MARILLVEDEPLVRELAHEDLVDAGYEVVAARNGEEAIGILDLDSGFQALFTDIRMPGSVDGWQVARVAMQRIPGIKVIYTTGLADGGHALGPDERSLQKPYRVRDVLVMLQECGVDA